MTNHNYAGTWQLIPQLCFYETGDPPEKATYEIQVADGHVRFSIAWTKDGHNKSIEFGGPLDGQLHPSSTPPDSEVYYTQIDGATLESDVFADGVRVAFARRQVSQDRGLMAVLQVNGPKDAETRITQVYRRIA